MGSGRLRGMSETTGVVFPLVDGRRSTAATGRTVVADALRSVDPIGAGAADRETNWRAGYLVHFRRLVEAGLPSPDAALTIARDGLGAVHSLLKWGDPDAADAPLASAFRQPPAPVATTSGTVRAGTAPPNSRATDSALTNMSGAAIGRAAS